ncbi:hypothetical protein ACFQ48_10225 [Hymenobacter caeli]|uniref:DUF3298 domain-containing protein n=1 Tax=Hymenobacter caeli TaxID=2735894 RepID=A0ABX2FRH4_9BACT|nr:hypothetical protein [Hymenobacter caeli]NRT19780.1 hypothetical protein [Hymenobacter caeli]
MGLVLARAPARAQSAPGGRAQVYSVTEASFTVPQVKLADAAVARRINRVLLRHLVEETVDSTASAHRQLRQAALACCYDQENHQWMASGMGYSGTSYKVLLNQGYLLSFEFHKDYNGLEWPAQDWHLTFDLRTGRVLTLADVVADPPAQLDRRLGWAVDRRLKDELAKVAETYGDSSIVAHVADLYGLSDWITPTTPVAPGDTAADESGTRFKLLDFALRPHALLLFHAVDMGRFDFPFLPDPTYTFPYARLRPRGLLVPLAKAAALTKSK